MIGNSGIISQSIITLNRLKIKINNIITEKKIKINADSHNDKNKSHHFVTEFDPDQLLIYLSKSLKSKTDNPINNKGPETES
jgi:hypothetical protein